MVTGFLAAAEETRAPVILAFNRHVTPDIPIELGLPLAVQAAQQARVPVATFLDHGHSFEEVAQAIRLGASSVMFDGSALPYEENVRQTREIVRMAHAMGVAVEAELGSIAGSAVEIGDAQPAPEAYFTDPALAAEFVKRTDVDVLAISFGNVHGPYRGEPRLDLERVRTIRALVEIPLAMHGGSGLADTLYPSIIASGISKLGYYTAMGMGAVATLRRQLIEAEPAALAYHHVISAMVQYFRDEARRVFALTGCVAKATP
ncbi:MAG: class II fructose-bisphosphate aldolase [Anaerolineae bacterium]|nr:class II fructose-bisphosphate aldolase [Anaerolineae bacterium]MDW8071599.1 class II fructose-bisphosphate aldolase [Anaerolineae bacterium]